MKNSGSTHILTNLVGDHLRNFNTKFEANLCSGSKEVNKSAKWHCGRHTLICKKNTN